MGEHSGFKKRYAIICNNFLFFRFVADLVADFLNLWSDGNLNRFLYFGCLSLHNCSRLRHLFQRNIIFRMLHSSMLLDHPRVHKPCMAHRTLEGLEEFQVNLVEMAFDAFVVRYLIVAKPAGVEMVHVVPGTHDLAKSVGLGVSPADLVLGDSGVDLAKALHPDEGVDDAVVVGVSGLLCRGRGWFLLLIGLCVPSPAWAPAWVSLDRRSVPLKLVDVLNLFLLFTLCHPVLQRVLLLEPGLVVLDHPPPNVLEGRVVLSDVDLEHGGGQLARALEAALAADAGVPRPPRDGAPPRLPNDLLPTDAAALLGGHSDILWDEVLGRGSLLGRFLLLRGNLLNDPLALFPFTLHLSDPLLLRMSPRLLPSL